MRNLVSFIVGLIFALGLGVSGMTQVHIVRGFLDVLGSWNPALIGVMVGAIIVHSIFYFFIKKRVSPLLDTKFYIPTRHDLDVRLLAGAAIFGLGWGWAGICPGPGLVSMTSGNTNIIIFVVSLIIGMILFKAVDSRFNK